MEEDILDKIKFLLSVNDNSTTSLVLEEMVRNYILICKDSNNDASIKGLIDYATRRHRKYSKFEDYDFGELEMKLKELIKKNIL